MADPKSSTGWRGKNPRKGSKKTKSSLNQAIGLLIVAIVAIVGTILGLVFYAIPKPEPILAGFWVTDYSDARLPIDPTSKADRDSLLAGKYFKEAVDGFSDSWGKTAKALEKPKETDTVVVYLSAASCLDESGNVLLLPGDANPDTRTGWITLDEVLKAIKACKSKQKLVLLDVHRPLVDPTLGFLTNDIAGRVVEEVGSVNDPARLVLMSCAPGQVSLGSELLGRSIFNYYVEEALRGWADEKDKDGDVDARELADYVTTRVQDWAKRTRNTAQSPTLIGESGLNFKLVVVPREGNRPRLNTESKIATALDPAAAKAASKDEAKKDEPKKDESKKEAPTDSPGVSPTRPYPQYLTEGWQLAETWRKERATVDAPRPLMRLEAALLKAEREFRFDRDEAATRSDLAARRAAARQQYVTATTLTLPERLPTVALAVALGNTPDPALATETQGLFARRAQRNDPTLNDDKLRPEIKAFFDKAKPANEVDLSAAVLNVLSNPEAPQKRVYFDMIKFADLILREYRLSQSKSADAPYMETLFLQQMIALAPVAPPAAPNAPPPAPLPPPWSNDVLIDAVKSVWRGERLSAQADVFPWVEKLIDEAAVKRHTAQVLLRSPGYVLPKEVLDALTQANVLDQRLEEIERAFLDANRVLGESQNVLPALLDFLRATGDAELGVAWQRASEAAADLAGTLKPPTEAEAKTQWTRDDFTQTRVAEWRTRSDAVSAGLRDLMQRLAPRAISAAILSATAPAAPPEAWTAIDALLSSSLIPIDQREKLIAAANTLDRALHKKHFDTTTFTSAASNADDARALELKLALERADRSIALLRLGGIDTTPADQARQALANKLDTTGRNALTKAVWTLWKSLPDRLQNEKDLATLQRLARIAPPLQLLSAMDNEGTAPPTTQLRQSRLARLWNWSSDFYRYLANDIDAGDVIKESSNALSAIAVQQTPRSMIKLERDPSVPVPVLKALDPKGSVAVLLTRLDGNAPGDDKPPLRILPPPDPKLSAVNPEMPTLELRQPTKLGIGVELLDGSAADPSAPAPRGLMVEVVMGDRPYYLRSDINFGTALEPLKLVLSDDPKSAANPIARIGLRTIAAKQSYFVWVKNPTSKPRNVEVRLIANGDDTPIGTAKLRVEPNETRAVSAFATPPAPPAAPGTPPPTGAVELKTGLAIKVYDSDRLAVAADEGPIDLLAPEIDLSPASDLIQVVEIKYTPPNETNGFRNSISARLRAKTALSEGPCNVSMILPRELIAGLKGPAVAEQLSGILKAQGEEVTLSATGLDLDPNGDDSASFFIAIDGDARALKYKTIFDRQGLVSRTPQLDTKPALRLSGSSLAEMEVKYPLTMAVDNPPDDRSTIVVGFVAVDSTGKETLRFDQTVPARNKRIAVTPDPKGALAFEASIADQTIALETRGLSAAQTIQATLLNGRARPEGQVQTLKLILDRAPVIQSFEIAKSGSAGLLMRASGSSHSGITTVKFFTGLPLDNKIPSEKDAVTVAKPEADGSFQAILPLPKDAKGRIDLGVEFTNNLKKTAYKTLTYDVPGMAANMAGGLDGGGAKPDTGAVTGRVLLGETEQPKLKVDVYAKDKDELVSSGTTDAKGVFTIDKLKPGTYRLYVTRSENNSYDFKVIDIKAGETLKQDLSLMAR